MRFRCRTRTIYNVAGSVRLPAFLSSGVRWAGRDSWAGMDYGCGKGCVGFFLSDCVKTRIIGIEYDERIYKGAMDNLKTAVSGIKSEFVLTKAEGYEVSGVVNRCYFLSYFRGDPL